MKKNTTIAKKRVHAYYSGMVQGVGFRYTAENMARTMAVSGWVRNLADGRVELVCEGYEDTLAELLAKIKNGALRTYIQEVELEWSDATGEFSNFQIRFW